MADDKTKTARSREDYFNADVSALIWTDKNGKEIKTKTPLKKPEKKAAAKKEDQGQENKKTLVIDGVTYKTVPPKKVPKMTPEELKIFGEQVGQPLSEKDRKEIKKEAKKNDVSDHRQHIY